MTQTEQSAALSEQWQQHVKAWQTSGLSQAGYCEQHNLIYHRFGYWYRKLKSASKKDRKESGFARVMQQSRTASPGLAVRLPNGVELRGVDEDNLVLVNQLLRQWS